MATAAAMARRYRRMATEALERGDIPDYWRCRQRAAEWEALA